MTTPATTDTEIIATIRASWDAEAASYDREPGHGLTTERERWAWRRVLGEALQPLAGSGQVHVLDVGTGTGSMAVLLGNMGYKVSAIDISPAMLQQARAKSNEVGVPVTFLEGLADELPLPDASVDAVFSRHLFWTLPDPTRAVREWARVVRPGGMVLIADGWWQEPGLAMQGRRAIGKFLRALFEHEREKHGGYGQIGARLPVSGGVSPYSIRYYLDSANLKRIRVRDLASIRRAELPGTPLWRRIDRARFTWLASAYRPETE